MDIDKDKVDQYWATFSKAEQKKLKKLYGQVTQAEINESMLNNQKKQKKQQEELMSQIMGIIAPEIKNATKGYVMGVDLGKSQNESQTKYIKQEKAAKLAENWAKLLKAEGKNIKSIDDAMMKAIEIEPNPLESLFLEMMEEEKAKSKLSKLKTQEQLQKEVNELMEANLDKAGPEDKGDILEIF